jgi:hypothetical protein
MAQNHGGTHLVKGQLNRGPRPQPATTSGGSHGGTLLPKGQVHDAAAPKPPQSSTSWHAMAAASLKRK